MKWSQSKQKALSNSNGSIHNMSHHLAPNWLANSEKINMLKLIQEKVLDGLVSCPHFQIQNTFFTLKLLEAFTSGSTEYLAKQLFGWLCQLGNNM